MNVEWKTLILEQPREINQNPCSWKGTREGRGHYDLCSLKLLLEASSSSWRKTLCAPLQAVESALNSDSCAMIIPGRADCEAAGADPTPALCMQKTSRCWPRSWGGWTVVTGNKTVWNWWAVPLRPSTELNLSDCTGIPRTRYPWRADTSHCLVYALLGVPDSCQHSVSRDSLGIPNNSFWDCTSVGVPWLSRHCLGPGRLSTQLQLTGQTCTGPELMLTAR